jgi:hypothetical protein
VGSKTSACSCSSKASWSNTLSSETCYSKTQRPRNLLLLLKDLLRERPTDMKGDAPIGLYFGTVRVMSHSLLVTHCLIAAIGR